MKKKWIFCGLIFSVLCHFSLTTFAMAEDIPVIINNTSSHDVTMAVSYYDLPKRSWVVLGWIAAPARSNQTKVISTGNLHLYYYAISDGGTIYQGSKNNSKDRALVVSDAPFFVRQGKKPQEGEISTRYFKYKRATQRKFIFNF